MSEICPVCDGAGKICTCDDPDGCQKYYDLGVCKACLLRQGDEYVRTGMSGVWNKIIGPVLMAITGTYHYLLNDDTVTGSIWIVGAIIVLVLSDR